MRLLTRSDFDGLVCGALLTHLGIVDDFLFVHPKDIQDGRIPVTKNDVLANVPYVKECGLWFEHHSSELERSGGEPWPNGIAGIAPSCARVVYEYYGGQDALGHFSQLLDSVDRMDAAQLTSEEILNPQGWILLGYIMDPRTGLGRFRDFTISNIELMKELMYAFIDKSLDEILALPDVQERVEVYREQASLFIKMVKEKTRTDGPVIISDLRGVETINAGNRFIVYTLFPEQNISLWIVDGRNRENCVIAVGHSIVNRSSTIDVGSMLIQYGGGGHRQAGTCQVDYAAADAVIQEIVALLKG